MPDQTPYLSNSDLTELVTWRRMMHRFPEVSGDEAQTARRVTEALAELYPDEIVNDLGGHGVAAVFNGAADGPTVLLRCELDALPIAEESDLSYRSEVPGKGHLCGHDGHMTMIMATARWFSRNRSARGRVVMLFQPAEEDGSGAARVIADPKFAALTPNFALALHNAPGLPLGHIAIAPGPANCASRGIKIALKGRTAHASLPETGVSPASAVAQLMSELPAQGSATQVTDPSFSLVTLTHAKIGEPAFGIAPGDAEVWATLRTQTNHGMTALVEAAERLVANATHAGLQSHITYHDIFEHCENDPDMVDLVRRAADEEEVTLAERETPMRGSEDFGRFGTQAQAAMFLLGSGTDSPALHNPDFDFPDDLVPIGAKVFIRAVQMLLER